MSGESPSRRTLPQLRTAVVARAAAGAAAGSGLAVIVARLVGTSSLAPILPSWVPSGSGSAVCALLAGAAAVLTTITPSNGRVVRSVRGVALAAAAVCFTLAVVSLVGYAAGFEPGFTRALSAGHGRMRQLSSVCFALLGAALLLLNTPPRWAHTAGQALGVAACVLSYFAALAMAFNSPSLFRALPIVFVSPLTVLIVMLTGIGTILARPDGGVVESLSSRGPGGALLRSFLLYSLTVPPILVTLRYHGEKAGVVDLPGGLAILATTNILLFCIVAWFTARAVDRVDAKRRTADRRRIEAEGRHRAILDRMMEGCQIVDFDWRYVYLNARAAAQAMKEPGDLIGRTMMESFPGIETSPLFTVLSASMIDREARRIENEFHHADGSSAWFDLSIQPVPEGLFILSIDITARKRTEEALRESEQKFGVIFRRIPFAAALSRIDDGGIVDVNDAFEKQYGVPRARAIGMTSAELGINPDDELRRRFIAELRTRGSVHDAEMPLNTVSGQRIFLVSIETVRIGEESYFLQTAQDITERKHAEEKVQNLAAALERRVRERTAQLEAVNRELEAFSYSVSHDLRAPLRHIAGFSDLIVRNKGSMLDDDGRRMLSRIQEAAGRMAALIDDLLKLSRASRAEMRYRMLDLGAVARETIAAMEGEIAQRVIHWSIGDIPPVAGDAALLRLVMQNLLDNAVKYTRPRSIAEISVRGETIDGETVITVSDNGVGFDRRYIDKLFGVFQRLHGSDEFEGTGVGLANVRRIVQRHGGRTWADGDIGKGAAISFSLPVRDPEEAGTGT